MTISESEWSARRIVRGRRAALLLALAVLAGVGSRMAVERASPIFASDTFQSLSIARSLVEGRGFTSGGAEHPDASRSVLFPTAIAAVDLVVRNEELAARIVVLLSGALIVLPMFFLARSALGPGAALAALPIGALSCIVGASSRLLSTSLFVLLAMSTVAAFWSAGTRRSFWRWILAGGVMGLAALTRPEGLMLPPALAIWTLITVWWRGHWRRRAAVRAAACTGLALAAFVAVYTPYAVWASARLGRFSPAPGVEYVRAERRVSDYLQLREMNSAVPWTSRARFMLTRDHGGLFLESYFLNGRFPEPDPDVVPPEAGEGAELESRNEAAPWRGIVQRRWNIVRGNLARAPRKAYGAHFLPTLIVGLGAAGAVSACLRRRGRQVLLMLGLSGIASLAPFANHIEYRFFCWPFALGAMVAAGGWAALDRVIRRGATPNRARWILPSMHLAIAGWIAWLGAHHEGVRSEALARAALLRSHAASVGARAAPGPILAIDPHFPYWAARRYRPVPFATPAGILDFARVTGATAMVLEGERDLAERPDLAWLTQPDLPAQFRLLEAVGHPEGGELRVFVFDFEATGP